MSKLSENQLKEIRKLKKEGFSCNDMAYKVFKIHNNLKNKNDEKT